MHGVMMFKQTQTPLDVPGNWPVMRVPQFIALRRNEIPLADPRKMAMGCILGVLNMTYVLPSSRCLVVIRHRLILAHNSAGSSAVKMINTLY